MLRVLGLGFRVEDLGFRVEGLGVRGLRLQCKGSLMSNGFVRVVQEP